MIDETVISPISDSARAAVLALNNEHAAELSWLEPQRLSFLIGEAFYARRIGDLEAFLLAFDQAADYDSPNYLWFKSRYPRFVYVDRIAVAASARGRGHARRLYEDLFGHASQAGHDVVVCEVNSAAQSGVGRLPCSAWIFRGRPRVHPRRSQIRPVFRTPDMTG